MLYIHNYNLLENQNIKKKHQVPLAPLRFTQMTFMYIGIYKALAYIIYYISIDFNVNSQHKYNSFSF